MVFKIPSKGKHFLLIFFPLKFNFFTTYNEIYAKQIRVLIRVKQANKTDSQKCKLKCIFLY